MIRLLLSLIILTSLMPSPALAGGRKKGKARVSFHLQGQKGDGPKMVSPLKAGTQTAFFRISPEINTKDIDSFKPFPFGDGYGIVFKLTETGAKRLHHISIQEQGKQLLASVNGRPLDLVLIDRPVRDGILVVWSGITLADIRLLDFLVPRIGEDPKKWKKRLKQLKKKRKKKLKS